jgi:hypothetical protein
MFCATAAAQSTLHYSITLVLPQDAHIADLLQALRERLQLPLPAAGGASPLQLRLLLLNISSLAKLLQPTDDFKDGFGGGVYNRDDLLDRSLYYRREGKERILLESVSQVSCTLVIVLTSASHR